MTTARVVRRDEPPPPPSPLAPRYLTIERGGAAAPAVVPAAAASGRAVVTAPHPGLLVIEVTLDGAAIPTVEYHRDPPPRVAVVLRGSSGGAGVDGGPVTRLGDLLVHWEARAATRGGATVRLRRKELDLLAALHRAAGRVVAREALLREVWGYRDGVRSRTLDTHVAELRRKVEPDPARPRHILTVRGVGYRLVE